MDVENGATTDGADIIQMSDSGSNSQRWQLRYDGAGYFRLKNINSGKVLDVSSGSASDGENILQWADTGASNQAWNIQP